MSKEKHIWTTTAPDGATITFEMEKGKKMVIDWDWLVDYRNKVTEEMKLNEDPKKALILRGEDHALMVIMAECSPLKEHHENN